LVGLDGGGDGDRTCDPLVNEAGSRMIKSETFCESAESSRGRRVPPVWRGGPGGTTLERCLPPLAHAASPVLSVAAAPALRPPPLRSSGTELPQPDFRQGRFVRAVTRSMCWQKFDPPLDPRTHSAIRFGSRNSHSMRFKRRSSRVFQEARLVIVEPINA